MSTANSFAASLRCPDDGDLLQAQQSNGVPFASCRLCDGLWFSRDAIDRGGKPSLPAASKSRSARVSSKADRACPECRVKLDAEPVNNVVIDVCPRCGGVWLDPGEYQMARRRSVRLRLERDVPAFRENTSKLGAFVDRIIDAIGERMYEKEKDEPEFDARGLIPRKRRDR